MIDHAGAMDAAEASVPVVGIGASAGGLEAIGDLLEGLPVDTGLAFLIVSHLDPTHESFLVPLLRKRTEIPVVEAEDELAVVGDCIYVIRPGTFMTLAAGKLRLTPRENAASPHTPINALFNSIAEHAGRAIAVVLSGTGSDGAEGVKAVKEAAGIVFVQDPASSRYRGMPDSALQTGCVDYVLPPREIAHELARVSAHPYLKAHPADAASDLSDLSPANLDEDDLARVFAILFGAYKADFSQYKRSTVQRRLRRRMALRQIDAVSDYLDLINGDAGEVAALYDDLLIRVTSFFRDPDIFDELVAKVFPAICDNRTRSEPIRVWVPGCASGEEAYSIAIALLEYLGDRTSDISLQIFGTDLSEAAIDQARAARYPDIIAERVSARRLQRFFDQEQRSYRVAKWVRQLCLFARHNVARDPPFAKLDLVSCCNLLIYLNPGMQRQVIRNFHYGLKPNGFLLLGPAESIGEQSLYFQRSDPHSRFFLRQPLPTRMPLEVDAPAPRQPMIPGALAEAPRAIPHLASIRSTADRLVLARFGPPSILVDDQMNVVHFRGHTGPYLEHVSGLASLNLHHIARPGILVQLLAAIQQARESGAQAYRKDLRVDAAEPNREVELEVVPITDPVTGAHFFLVLFDTNTADEARETARAVPLTESEKDRRIVQLEREVADARSFVGAMNVGHEAAHEEAQSAMEELLSANEEFQSANEELETTKEELKSSNEELTTTNQELLHRTQELVALNSDVERRRKETELAQRYADAIIETVAHPLLVLNSGLVVQRANRSFYETFKTVASDTLHKHIFELGSGQWGIEPLRALLLDVLPTQTAIFGYQLSHDFRSLGRKTMRLHANKVEGNDERGGQILLAIEDITDIEQKADARGEADRRKDEFLAILAHELRNPLAPITNALSILRETVQSDQTLRYVTMMERQVSVMTRLLDDLMDISRITHGVIKLELASIDMRALVSEAIAAAKPNLDARRHQVSVALPDSSVVVKADAVRLEQVVGNLLSNAAKYTDPGGHVTVTLSAEQTNALLTVQDTGIGMAPGVVPHVFDLFMQANARPGDSRGGLGVGLSLVRRLVELHGGTVTAKSDGPGKGSEFSVRLPLREALVSPLADEAGQRKRALNGCRLLVVDDNADSTSTIVDLARIWGHEAAYAYDGLSAIELARSFQPDVALLDIGLPDINGYALARELRKIPGLGRACLVAMTGYGQPTDRDAAVAAGFDVHLVKPVALGALQTLLATLPQGNGR